MNWSDFFDNRQNVRVIRTNESTETSILRSGENLHVECEFELGIGVRVVHFEQAMHEFFQIDIAAWVEVKHGKEALADDSWELWVLFAHEQRNRWIMIWEETQLSGVLEQKTKRKSTPSTLSSRIRCPVSRAYSLKTAVEVKRKAEISLHELNFQPQNTYV